MSVFCFTSHVFDIFSVATKLETKGWRIDRQRTPPSIHMIVTQNHQKSASEFVRDLKMIAAKEPKRDARKNDSSAVSLYGVTNKFNAGSDPVESLYRAMESVYD